MIFQYCCRKCTGNGWDEYWGLRDQIRGVRRTQDKSNDAWGTEKDQLSRSVMSDSLWTHELQHTRPPCPSPAPGVYSNSCPLSQWCHPGISSSVISFSFCLQSFPASGSFQKSQFFASSGQSIGDSALASVLSLTIQDWFPLGCIGWISLQS